MHRVFLGRRLYSVSREQFLKQTQEKLLQYDPDPLMRELRDRLEGKICKPVSYKFLEYAKANGMWDLVRKASVQVTDGYVPGYTIALSSKTHPGNDDLLMQPDSVAETPRWLNDEKTDGDHPFIELGYKTSPFKGEFGMVVAPVMATLHLCPGDIKPNFEVDLLVNNPFTERMTYHRPTPLPKLYRWDDVCSDERKKAATTRRWLRVANSCHLEGNIVRLVFYLDETEAGDTVRFQFHQHLGSKPCVVPLSYIELKIMSIVSDR